MYENVGLPLPWGIIPTERLFEVVRGPAPAIGAEFTFTVPGNKVWKPLSLRVQFTTSAVAATRGPTLVFDDGNVEYARVGDAFGSIAGQNAQRTWALGLGSSFRAASNYPVASPLPDLFMLPGHRIRSNTIAIDGGDQYGEQDLWVVSYEVRGLERAFDRYVRAVADATGTPG